MSLKKITNIQHITVYLNAFESSDKINVRLREAKT